MYGQEITYLARYFSSINKGKYKYVCVYCTTIVNNTNVMQTNEKYNMIVNKLAYIKGKQSQVDIVSASAVNRHTP
jgi:hypothetical protein